MLDITYTTIRRAVRRRTGGQRRRWVVLTVGGGVGGQTGWESSETAHSAFYGFTGAATSRVIAALPLARKS